MSVYEPLTHDHFIEYGETDIIPEMTVGYARRGKDGRIEALGGIWFVNGYTFGFLHSRDVPHLGVHRMALKVLNAVRQAGATHVDTIIDHTKPNAEKWARRIGFKPFAKNDAGQLIWRLEWQ